MLRFDVQFRVNTLQEGQALPVGMAFIAFCALLTLVLFNSGQLINEKTKLTNTADAAVYSGLVWQARALNFQAYTNRAMVANQVSIAQLVSINSWTEYGNITTRNVNNTIGLFPPFRPFTQGAAVAMSQINIAINMVVGVAIPVIDGVNRVLSNTQRAMYLATFSVTPSIVREVVQANDPDYDVDSAFAIASLGENALEWNNFVTRYDDVDGLRRKASVINRSKDDFTRDRNWDYGRFYLGPTFRVELVKEGETNLIYDEDSGAWAWKGKDTLSVHAETYRCSWRGCRWRHNEIPVGWGAAYSPNDVDCENEEVDPAILSAMQGLGISISLEQLINEGFIAECGRFFDKNETAERLANSEAIDVGNYSGVQAYYDMTDLSDNNKDPRMKLRVEVQVAENNIRTSTKLNGVGSNQPPDQQTNENGMGSGVFWAGDKTAANTVASMSTGEVYFERPVYRDEYQLRLLGRVQREYGSLFNPYWQVRLTDTPDEIRLASWAIREPGIVTGSASGVVNGLNRYVTQAQEELSAFQELETYAEQEIAQMANYSNLQNQLQGQLNGYENDISRLESEIATLQSSNASAALIAQRESELETLQNTYSSEQQEYAVVTESLEAAQMYEQQIPNIGSQIQNTQVAINSPPSSGLIEFSGNIAQGMSMAGGLSSNGMQNLQQQFQRQGQEALSEAIEDALTDQLEDILASAATSIFSNYAGNYSGYVQQAQQMYQQAEGAVASVQENYIAPLEEQIVEMRAGIAQTRQQMETQMNSVLSTIDDEIGAQRNRLGAQQIALEASISQEITALESELVNATTSSEQQGIREEINAAQQRLADSPQALREQMETQIDTLEDQRDQMADEFSQQISNAESSVLDEIARVEQQIEALRSRATRG